MPTLPNTLAQVIDDLERAINDWEKYRADTGDLGIGPVDEWASDYYGVDIDTVRSIAPDSTVWDAEISGGADITNVPQTFWEPESKHGQCWVDLRIGKRYEGHSSSIEDKGEIAAFATEVLREIAGLPFAYPKGA